MPFLTTNGARLHYLVKGEGPPLLMIAGLASDSASWAPVIERLSARYKTIIPDNRGVGRTQSDGPIALNDFVDDLIALLDHLSIRRTHICGHSMGGAIAMGIASQWPGRVADMVLAAAGPKLRPLSWAAIDALTTLREAGAPEEPWFRSFFTWLFKPDFFDDPRAVAAAIAMAQAYPLRQSAQDMRRQVDAMEGLDLRPALEAITARTLILRGRRDMLFPIEDQNPYAQLSSHQVRFLDAAAHSLHWDAPDAFCDALTTFLGEIAP